MSSPVTSRVEHNDVELKLECSPKRESPKSDSKINGKRLFQNTQPNKSESRSLRYRVNVKEEDNPYSRAAKEIGSTKWKQDSNALILFKEITVQGKKISVDTEILGKGDSFQCYQVSGEPRVIKIFVCIQDPSSLKKRPISAEQLNVRIDFLAENYRRGLQLGIPCARIENIETLKEDGCIVQEQATPVVLTWNDPSRPLTEVEKNTLSLFCDCLEKAIVDADSNVWDLPPKNFGFDEEGELRLFDISDRPLSANQWIEFQSAIIKWSNGHPEAKSLILERLKALPDQPKLAILIDRLYRRE